MEIATSSPNMSEQESKASDTFLTIPVDAEHGGIRTAGCLSFLGIGVVSFFVLNVLFAEAILLVMILSGGLAAGLSYLLDNSLKKNWPSGRSLKVSPNTIQLTKKGAIEIEINPQQQINALMWHFKAPKHPRVPKNWYVAAIALEQDHHFIPVYTILSPDDFQSLALSQQYFEHKRKKERDKKKNVGHSLRAAGQQRRIDEAEYERGINGAEMTVEQYKSFFDYLTEQFPQWMPAN